MDAPVPERHHDEVIGAGTALPYIGRAVQRSVVAAAFREPGHIVVLSGEAGLGESSMVAVERAAAVTEVIRTTYVVPPRRTYVVLSGTHGQGAGSACVAPRDGSCQGRSTGMTEEAA